MLFCTICQQREAFIKLRLELPNGAATYLICTQSSCIEAAAERAKDNLHNAAAKVLNKGYPAAVDTTHRNVIDVEVIDP